MIALLDVNVLIALAWPNHLHHDAAHRWWAQNLHRGWASCPATQAGFVRVSAQPSAVHMVIAVHDAISVLEHNIGMESHHFWPQTATLPEMAAELRGRVMGPKQLSDAILVDIAVRNKGVLATFDRRIAEMLSPDSALRAHIEVLPIE
jgi:uncharacterized protein